MLFKWDNSYKSLYKIDIKSSKVSRNLYVISVLFQVHGGVLQGSYYTK